MCRVLQVSPSGFYAWRNRPASAHAQRDQRLRVLIRASHEASRRRYGSPHVHEDLREQGEAVSRKRVVRLMQLEGLRARARKRFKSTTMSEHGQPVAANVLDRNFVAAAPNQRWVADTSEFVTGSSGKLYLAAVLDLFSRFAVGWAVSAINDRRDPAARPGRAAVLLELVEHENPARVQRVAGVLVRARHAAGQREEPARAAPVPRFEVAFEQRAPTRFPTRRRHNRTRNLATAD